MFGLDWTPLYRPLPALQEECVTNAAAWEPAAAYSMGMCQCALDRGGTTRATMLSPGSKNMRSRWKPAVHILDVTLECT